MSEPIGIESVACRIVYPMLAMGAATDTPGIPRIFCHWAIEIPPKVPAR